MPQVNIEMDGLAAERTLFTDFLVRDEAVTLMTEMNQSKRHISDRQG